MCKCFKFFDRYCSPDPLGYRPKMRFLAPQLVTATFDWVVGSSRRVIFSPERYGDEDYDDWPNPGVGYVFRRRSSPSTRSTSSSVGVTPVEDFENVGYIANLCVLDHFVCIKAFTHMPPCFCNVLIRDAMKVLVPNQQGSGCHCRNNFENVYISLCILAKRLLHLSHALLYDATACPHVVACTAHRWLWQLLTLPPPPAKRVRGVTSWFRNRPVLVVLNATA